MTLPKSGRTCTATNRAGTRCRRSPIKGGMVCDLHGGKAPQVVAEAKRRLMEAADEALGVLLDLMHNARDEAVRQRAAVAVMDRAGLGPISTQVAVDGGQVRYDIAGVDLDQL